jgi:hypothetical protein
MDCIDDPRLVEILTTRACSGLPADLCSSAYRVLRLLLAARAWSDVEVFTQIAALPDGRFAAPAHGKWVIVFEWLPGSGARNLALQRA